jgi:hypothetical protein
MEAWKDRYYNLEQEKIEDVSLSLKRKMSSQKTAGACKIVTVADLWRRLV